MRELLSFYDFDGDNIPVVKVRRDTARLPPPPIPFPRRIGSAEGQYISAPPFCSALCAVRILAVHAYMSQRTRDKRLLPCRV